MGRVGIPKTLHPPGKCPCGKSHGPPQGETAIRPGRHVPAAGDDPECARPDCQGQEQGQGDQGPPYWIDGDGNYRFADSVPVAFARRRHETEGEEEEPADLCVVGATGERGPEASCRCGDCRAWIRCTSNICDGYRRNFRYDYGPYIARRAKQPDCPLVYFDGRFYIPYENTSVPWYRQKIPQGTRCTPEAYVSLPYGGCKPRKVERCNLQEGQCPNATCNGQNG